MSKETQVSPEVREQAAAGFARLRPANVSEVEREQFFRWLMQSSEHVQAYVEAALLYWDACPVATCDRLTNRLEEACSATRPRKLRNGVRRA